MPVYISCCGHSECSHYNGYGKIIGLKEAANCIRCGTTGIYPTCKGMGKIKS